MCNINAKEFNLFCYKNLAPRKGKKRMLFAPADFLKKDGKNDIKITVTLL